MSDPSSTGTPAGRYRSLDEFSAALNRAILDLDESPKDGGSAGDEDARLFVADFAGTVLRGLRESTVDLKVDTDLGSLLIELKRRADTPEVSEGLAATVTAIREHEPLPEEGQQALLVVSSVLESELARRFHRLVAG